MDMHLAHTIEAEIEKAGFTERPELRQTLALAEEVGEFVGTVRRFYGLTRRTDTWEHVCEELADVVIVAYVTAAAMDIALDDIIDEKVRVIFDRGWREPANGARDLHRG